MKSSHRRLSVERLEDRTNPSSIADFYNNVWNTYTTQVFLEELMNADMSWLAFPQAQSMLQNYFTNVFQQAQQTFSLFNQFPGQMPSGPVLAFAQMQADFATWVGSVFGFSVNAPTPSAPSTPSNPSVGPASPATSTVGVSPASVQVGNTSTITLTAKDANGQSL